ncbi:hypothetical protein PHAVU_011G143000 [Phaseolus vulgaris]|uniref:Plastocyanin-like domain-containing protein n=1 Tax=Phaseolus vulgaris TaxID=3885 RepID=V7ALH2_PHAVU|nr:hypothetical protein PHAVU_011G143000g [Phaseolus vulgaris]ESW04996.1 hypothetical protein PHAVU_011G143000g [Phaseolus vulgaris]
MLSMLQLLRAIPTLLILCFFLIFGNFHNAEARNRHYKWEVKNEYRSPDCFKKLVITINGITPGPTIQAQEGDTVVVQLNNTLMTENLSIHWHEIRQTSIILNDWYHKSTYEQAAELSSIAFQWVGEPQFTKIIRLSIYSVNHLQNQVKLFMLSNLSWNLYSTAALMSLIDSFKDVFKLYVGGIKVSEGILKNVRDKIPAELLKELLRTDGERFLKFPVPQVIKEVVGVSKPSVIGGLFKIAGNSRGFQKPPGIAGFSKPPK